MNQISKNNILSSIMVMEHYQKNLEKCELNTMKSYSDYFSMEQENRSLLNDNHMYKIYLFEKRNEGKKACTYASILMHFAVRYESVDTIDTFFESLDKKALTSWSLMALLRTTYSYRRRISQWEKLYKLTYEQVEQEGLNPKRELYGLDA